MPLSIQTLPELSVGDTIRVITDEQELIGEIKEKTVNLSSTEYQLRLKTGELYYFSADITEVQFTEPISEQIRSVRKRN